MERAMRGDDERTDGMFSYVRPEERVPADHPLRPIREIVDRALESLTARFEALYSRTGRPSIPPEKLLRGLLLQAFYSVRSERQLMEQLEYNLLFRWFVGLSMDAPVWDATTFSKNRDRLLDGDIAREFMAAVLNPPEVRRLLSKEHFSVDGTLIEAWASMKSFRPKDGSGEPPTGGGRNAERDFHGEKRTNATHASTTDPDARLYRKSPGQGAKLCHMGHLTMENRHGLIVDRADARDGVGRARGGRGDDRRPAPWPARDAGGRQGLRHGRLCCGPAPAGRRSARRAEYLRPTLGHRRTDNAAPELRGEPACP
jgi:transposase